VRLPLRITPPALSPAGWPATRAAGCTTRWARAPGRGGEPMVGAGLPGPPDLGWPSRSGWVLRRVNADQGGRAARDGAEF
jgi:hypothetical protein